MNLVNYYSCITHECPICLERRVLFRYALYIEDMDGKTWGYEAILCSRCIRQKEASMARQFRVRFIYTAEKRKVKNFAMIPMPLTDHPVFLVPRNPYEREESNG